MKEENEDQIQMALQPAPMDRAPSEELVRKLRVLAHETPQKSRLGWFRFVVPAGAAAAVAAAVIVTTMLPAKAGARTLDMIEKAAASVNAFQFSILSDEKGKYENLTIAGADGHVYMKTGEGSIMQVDPGAMSIYDPEEKTVTRIKFGSSAEVGEIAKEVQSGISEGLKEMDLKKMLAEYKQKYGSEGIRVSPITQEDGHNVYHVTLSSKTEPERVEMTVDAATDLPEKLEVDSKDSDQNWKTSMKMEMRFGIGVDSNLLRADFPKDAKIEEIDLGAAMSGAMQGLEKLGDSFGKSLKKK